MKKIYLSVLLMGATLFSFAQGKIDMSGQVSLRHYGFSEKFGTENVLSSEINSSNTIQPLSKVPERVVVLVDLNKGADLAELEAEGAVVRSQIDNLALIEVDIDKVVTISNLKSVKTLSMPKAVYPKMDQARSKTGVNTVHRPLGALPQAYKGKGVVTGLVDAGVTANHPNFMNTDGSSRVKQAYTISTQQGVVTAYDTEEKLSQFTTDLATMSHGTHVAGIMAGGYKNLADTVNYYGVASESDIVMVGLGNDGYDNNILLGVEKIIEYAEANNQPVVVNLSMGSNGGPHDGTDLFSQYLDKLAERGVICVAAGNEASDGIAITKTCTDTDNNINTFIMPLAENGHTGTIEIWSDTDQIFKMTQVIYDLNTKAIVYEFPTLEKNTNGKISYIASGQYVEAGDMTSSIFENAFANGYIGFGSAIDSYNNRYTVMMQYYLLFNTVSNPQGKNLVYGIKVEGNPGQRLDVYCTTQYSTLSSYNVAGWTNGGGDGSITDISCAKNVISVGSFTSRDECPVRVKGARYDFSKYVALDNVSDFSSYATLVDGRKLPHLTAPGCIVVSSMSPYYMTLALQQKVYKNEYYLVAKTTYNGSPYYYDYMMGTSMAAPFTSGAAALMLQANPNLTPQEVRTILMETADKDSYVANSSNPVQWGAGKINVLAAVKKAIEYGAGVEDVVADADNTVFVTPVGNKQYDVTYVGGSSINATLYNMAGQAVVNASAEGNYVTIDASSVESGVYVLAVQSNGVNHTSKIVVK